MNKQYAMLTGTALGAGLMYLLDPRSGKRRRAYTKDKITYFRWTMLIDDTPVYWEPVIVVSNKALTWKTQPGAPLANSGTIRLDPAAAGTRVQVTLSCRPSRGLPNRIATHWFGPDLSRYLAESLAGMKRIIESEGALPEKPPAERTGS